MSEEGRVEPLPVSFKTRKAAEGSQDAGRENRRRDRTGYHSVSFSLSCTSVNPETLTLNPEPETLPPSLAHP